VKRACWLLLVLSFVVFPFVAQTNTPPASPPDVAAKSPDEMKALLAATFEHNTFANLPGPYHLLATFETFTAGGQPAGEGSIEKFFAAPGRLKIITRFRDHTMTAWYVDGKPVYTDDGFDGSIMSYLVDDFLLNPIPPPTGTARNDMQTKVMQMQGTTMDCGMFQFFVVPAGLPPSPKETYCVSRDTNDLVLRQTQYFGIRYREFAPFLGRSNPHYIVASQGTVVRCRIHVKQVDQQALDNAALKPPADASPVTPAPNWISTSAKEDTPLHKVAPSWPPGKSSTFAAGPVSLRILISRTGAVKDVELVYAPTAEFAEAAMDAVRQWTYAPILRKDKPVEAITTVFVNFALPSH
jgi:TonB family protein